EIAIRARAVGVEARGEDRRLRRRVATADVAGAFRRRPVRRMRGGRLALGLEDRAARDGDSRRREGKLARAGDGLGRAQRLARRARVAAQGAHLRGVGMEAEEDAVVALGAAELDAGPIGLFGRGVLSGE